MNRQKINPSQRRVLFRILKLGLIHLRTPTRKGGLPINPSHRGVRKIVGSLGSVGVAPLRRVKSKRTHVPVSGPKRLKSLRPAKRVIKGSRISPKKTRTPRAVLRAVK